jgi:hypothetical protein
MLFLVFTLGSAPLPVKGTYYLSMEKMFELSSENNIIVFILDSFDSEIFSRLLKAYPDLHSSLDGFTYYPDAVGVYPSTIYAMPQIPTGACYERDQKFSEFINRSWKK